MNNLSIRNDYQEGTVEAIYANCSGKSDSGDLKTAGALSIDVITDGALGDRIENINLTMAEFNIYSYNGSTTIQIDLVSEAYTEYYKTSKLLDNYFDENNNIENKLLSLTLIPYYYKGELIILFNNLIYYDYYKKDKGAGYRIILTFDETETKFLQTDGMDYDALNEEAIQRENSEIRMMEAEIDKYNEDIQALEAQDNEYSKALEESLKKYNDPTSEIFAAEIAKKEKEFQSEKNTYMKSNEE